MLRLLLPFAAGILLSQAGTLPWGFLGAGIILSGLLALWMQSRAAAFVMVFLAGFAAARLDQPQAQVPRGTDLELALRIESIPSGNKATAVLEAWRDDPRAEWQAASERLMVWGDSTLRFMPEERIVCRSRIRPLKSRSRSYLNLMQRRGYTGSVFVAGSSIGERTPARTPSLHLRAVEKIHKLHTEGETEGVIRAMVAGDRSCLGKELRTAFSRSGFAHLLSVSGLHTGMVFLLVNLLLWWMPLLRYGHLLRNLISIAVVWCYVMATGAAPSVIRAGIMYSLLQFCLFRGSEYLTLNTLAGAAMLMLLWHPAWIGDLSFQLSFLAVTAIVVWGIPLCRRIRSRNIWIDRLLQAWIISLVAGAATAPLISHTFGQIPLLGLVLNPVAILLGMAIVAAGTLWLLMPAFLAGVFSFPIALATDLLVRLARITSRAEWGFVSCSISGGATLLIYLFFAGITLLLWFADRKKALPLHL